MSIRNALRDLFAKDFDPATAKLYQACVTAARRPVFYTVYGVPDTVDGRFDLLLLHTTLVMLRLTDSAAKQRLFDLMFADMERSLREMGVGDMGIGKKMKPMLAGFYGRGEAYQAALALTGDEDLIAALTRNLYGKRKGAAEHAPPIARYMRDTVSSLTLQNESDLLTGDVFFPEIS